MTTLCSNSSVISGQIEAYIATPFDPVPQTHNIMCFLGGLSDSLRRRGNPAFRNVFRILTSISKTSQIHTLKLYTIIVRSDECCIDTIIMYNGECGLLI